MMMMVSLCVVVSVEGLVICELRTGELVIYEPIVRTTEANLEYNANQKVRTFYAIQKWLLIKILP